MYMLHTSGYILFFRSSSSLVDTSGHRNKSMFPSKNNGSVGPTFGWISCQSFLPAYSGRYSLTGAEPRRTKKMYFACSMNVRYSRLNRVFSHSSLRSRKFLPSCVVLPPSPGKSLPCLPRIYSCRRLHKLVYFISCKRLQFISFLQHSPDAFEESEPHSLKQ